MLNGKNKPDKKAEYLRERAERIAQLNADQQTQQEAALSAEEAAKAIHELRVHQIELEMQNEELRRTQIELEHERSRYFDLYEMAPVGYFTISENGIILENNLTVSNMLQISRANLFHKPITQFILRDDQDIYYLGYKRLLATEETQICEFRMVKNDGSLFWANMTATLAHNQKGELICRAAVSDISAQKEAELKLIYQSMHDNLTGLYNRAYYEESLERLEQGRQFPISILMVDVDQLKTINDQDGHAAGDQALINTAKLLGRSFRVEDTIARIGGDEFVVLMPDTASEEAEAALVRLRNELEKFNALQPARKLKLSCGLATAEKPTSLVKTLLEADTKMYLDKQTRGTNRS